MAAFDALHGLGPVIAGRQQSELAKDLARHKIDIQFEHPVLALADQEHLIGRITLVKDDVTLAIFSPFQGPEPIHGQIASRGGANLLDELQDLIKSDGMNW